MIPFYKLGSELRYSHKEFEKILEIDDDYELLSVIKYYGGWKVMVKKTEAQPKKQE